MGVHGAPFAMAVQVDQPAGANLALGGRNVTQAPLTARWRDRRVDQPPRPHLASGSRDQRLDQLAGPHLVSSGWVSRIDLLSEVEWVSMGQAPRSTRSLMFAFCFSDASSLLVAVMCVMSACFCFLFNRHNRNSYL